MIILYANVCVCVCIALARAKILYINFLYLLKSIRTVEVINNMLTSTCLYSTSHKFAHTNITQSLHDDDDDDNNDVRKRLATGFV